MYPTTLDKIDIQTDLPSQRTSKTTSLCNLVKIDINMEKIEKKEEFFSWGYVIELQSFHDDNSLSILSSYG